LETQKEKNSKKDRSIGNQFSERTNTLPGKGVDGSDIDFHNRRDLFVTQAFLKQQMQNLPLADRKLVQHRQQPCPLICRKLLRNDATLLGQSYFQVRMTVIVNVRPLVLIAVLTNELVFECL